MTAAIGTLGKLGIHTASPVTKRFDFQSESLTMQEDLIDANGVRGTRSRYIERVRGGLQRIGGAINLQPNTVELQLLLDWIMGAVSGTGPYTYTLSETLTSRYVVVDRITKVFTYAGVKINQATFSCQQGQPLSLSLNVLGQTETVGNSGTFPSIDIDLTTQPFILADLALTIGGTTVTPQDFNLTINNRLDNNRFFNSNTLVTVEALDRETTFSCMLPYGDASAIYNSGASGAEIVATFTNGVYVMEMTLPQVAFPRKSPNIPGRREVMLRVEGDAYRDGTDAELEVVLTMA